MSPGGALADPQTIVPAWRFVIAGWLTDATIASLTK
jgi:hypothetical protein